MKKKLILTSLVVLMLLFNAMLVSAVEVVKIGGVYPLSGPFSPMGEVDRNAIMLAVDQINAQGGVHSLGGAKLEVIFADSEGNPRVTITQTERLINQEGVVALLGSLLSGTTSAMAPVAERNRVPLVNEGSTSITLTDQGWNYFFRTTPHDGLYCQGMYDFITDLAAQRGVEIKTVGLMYENTDFGMTAADVWRELAPSYGLQVVADIPHAADAVDLSSEVTRLNRANPDIVFLASYTQDSILIARTMDDQNFTAKAIVALNGGHILPAFIDAVGDLANYIFAEARWSPDIAKPLAQEVNAEYRERFGSNLDGHSARAYTAMWALYYAIEEAGSTDKEAIRTALQNLYVPSEDIIMSWEGIQFDETGQNILGSSYIIQIQNQEFITVYPSDVAQEAPLFPDPKWLEQQ